MVHNISLNLLFIPSLVFKLVLVCCVYRSEVKLMMKQASESTSNPVIRSPARYLPYSYLMPQ